MGMLVEGVWHDVWYDTKANDGKFVRQAAGFRNWITADGSPGPSGVGGFAAAAGRYHLYVSYACPWAHRTLILRKLKGLEEMISVSVVHWHMAEQGWTFAACEGSLPDSVNQARYLYEIYLKDLPQGSTRLQRAGHRAGAVGQTDKEHRLQ